MSIIRVNKNKENPYLIMNKTGLNDDNLSLKAKGLLCYLLSLPDDWHIYENELINHSKDGRDSIRSAIKELIDNNYIKRDRKRDDFGHLRGYDYVVYEIPYIGKSNIGKTNIGKPDTINIITKPINKKLNNKDIIGNVTTFTFDEFLKLDLELSYIEDFNSARDIIHYYCYQYEVENSVKLKYDKKTWIKILENILLNDIEVDLHNCNENVELMKRCIDKHFETNYKNKEMYLLHNFKGKTKENRLYESGIL